MFSNHSIYKIAILCSWFPVRWPPPNGMIPLVPPLPPKIYHLHAIYSIWDTESHLHAIWSISEPQPSTCSLSAAFESHMLPTYDLCAVRIVTYSIYMLLFYLVYLYTSHSVSIQYSSVAYDWCIASIISIHRTYIVPIAYLYKTYVLFFNMCVCIYICTHVQHRKPPEPPPPTTGERRQPHTLPNPSYLYGTT